MQLRTQSRETDSPAKLHVCEPPPCTCCTTWTREVRKGVEEEVIDNADESVKQQAKSRYQDALLEGGQQRRIGVHGRH